MSSRTVEFEPPQFRLALVAAVALPTLLAYNLTPAATLYNELLALLGWGAVLLLGGLLLLAQRRVVRIWREPAVWALGLLWLSPVASVAFRQLPFSLGIGPAAVLASAVAVMLLACSLEGAPRRLASDGLCWGLLVAGLLSVAVSLVQVFLPALADGVWIARSGLVGRAIGNLRQPNHLASLLMWSSVAAVWLAGRHAVVRRALPGLLLALVKAHTMFRSGWISFPFQCLLK
jgi:hypothetical protein